MNTDKTIPEAAATTPVPDAQAELPFLDRITSDPISMNPIDAEPEHAAATCAESPCPDSTVAVPVPLAVDDEANLVVPETLGQRLRATRKARGLSCADAARALKLPANVLRALEAEQYDRIGHGVYLRGYLCKYLQLLDLPQVLAERVLHEHEVLPPLTTAVTMSRPRYLFERYSGSALYLILTAVIVVPAVLLAMHASLDQSLARITPLDTPPAKPAAPAVGAKPLPQTVASVPAPIAIVTPAKPDDAPLIASMTPFPAPAATAASKSSVASAADGTRHHLQLSLAEPSWVEVEDAAGKKLEYGLLPAGSVRDYASDQALDLRIGNASGATLMIDGKAQDLADFRHANVAHLQVVAGVASPSHSGG